MKDTPQKEVRSLGDGEVKMSANEGNIIEGYAARVNVWSEDMGFRELIEQGAFEGADLTDVRMLNDHLSNAIVARTKSNTLTVSVDASGLFFRGDIADTTAGRDLLVSVKRGDVSQASFGFTILEDEWDEDSNGTLTRRIKKIGKVVDVSPTAFPAYTQTSISQRKLGEIREVIAKKKTGLPYIDAMVKVHQILYT